MFRGDFGQCLNRYPNTTHRGSIDNLYRSSYSPLNDITGTLFEGISGNTRPNGFVQSRFGIDVESRGFRQEQPLYLIRNNSLNQSNISHSINGSESISTNNYLISNTNSRINGRPLSTNLNRVGYNSINRNNGEIGGYNRSYLSGNQIRMSDYTLTGYRNTNRSMSASSPNLNYVIDNDLNIGLNGIINSSEINENNCNILNRSRSFADRILEQFETIERERNDLTQMIQRSRSLYEQIQRNGEEVNRVLGSISERSERRLSRRNNYNNETEMPLRSQTVVFDSNRVPLSNISERTNASNGYTSNNRRIGRNQSIDNNLFEQQRRHNTINNHERRYSRRQVENIIDSNNYETETLDEDVLEMVDIDEELESYLTRRDNEIRNRSLILTREEVIIEEDDNFYDDRELIMADFGDNYSDELGYNDVDENSESEMNDEINDRNEEITESEGEYEVDENDRVREIRGISVNTMNIGGNSEGIRLGEIRDTFLTERPALNSEGLREIFNLRTNYADNVSDISGPQRRNILSVPLEIQSAFPVSKYDEKKSQNLDEDKKTCLICLENFKDKQEILWLPCTHCFCKECIISWFNRGSVCPICKDDILAHF
ncbi:asparagine-rich protein [Cryptosporidium xiaoi]|uniref:RING-type E3 ubiquitin transferase n=1 Tax=Cryptosporidium xiaoi TaxID=659607 RepID=A0AAV9Y5H6_9CRYT